MNQEDLNALMRNPWEAAKKPRPQPLPECPQCGERYCGDGIAFCTECANTVTPNTYSAGLLLCCAAGEANATSMTLDLDEVSQDGRDFGNWRVKVEKLS